MPGMRDCVIVTENMEKQKVQQRLLYFNIREVYELFKQKYPNEKIGFTKFSMLRPRECIYPMEKYGTHTTCVCSYHQNCKLIIDSLHKHELCDAKDYREVINMCLCAESIRTSKCTMKKYDNCPGTEALARHIESRLEENMIEQLIYKQWVTIGGKTSLENITRETSDFIREFCEQIEFLIPHDFIAKQQTSYLKHRQENIQPDEIVLIYDFSENYTCLFN